MVSISARDRLRYVATMNATLLDVATIERTGFQTNCRLEDGLRAMPVPGLPRMLRMRSMKLVLQNDPIAGPPDIWAGDTVSLNDPLTGRSMGSYFVMDKATPRTLAPATEVYCIMMVDEQGNSAFPSNSVVTLSSPTDNTLVLPNLRALIYPSTPEDMLTPLAVRYEWAIVIPKGTVYPGTTKEPQVGDLCTWAHFDRPVPLSERHPILEPVPAVCFYMKVVSDAQH